MIPKEGWGRVAVDIQISFSLEKLSEVAILMLQGSGMIPTIKRGLLVYL